MKKTKARISAMLLAVVMIAAIIPLQAFAAGGNLLGGDIQVDGADTVENDVVSVTAECGGNVFGPKPVTKTMTIKNVTGELVTVNFDFHVASESNTWKLKIDGKNVLETEGNLDITLEANASSQIELTSPNEKKTYDVTLTLDNFSIIKSSDAFDITFLPAAEGEGTAAADGEDITAGAVLNVTYGAGVQLEAVPADGYSFLAWVDENGNTVSSDAGFLYRPTKNATLQAKFMPAGIAAFGVGENYYLYLNDAIAAAQNGPDKLIYVAESGKLPAGNYTIPAGITLLIPFDEKNTVNDENVVGDDAQPKPQSAFRVLSFENGTHLTVNGILNVGGRHNSAFNGRPMGVTGKYGQIALAEGSDITMGNGSILYAWGFITGEGTLLAKAGSKIYELFQFTDFRGGTASLEIAVTNANYRLFPFSQYYIQNIESKITYEYGAEEFVTASVSAGGATVGLSPKFIGEGGLFILNEGSTLTKWYDSVKDQLQVEINGDAMLSKISVSLAGFDIASDKFVLPINNIMIHVKSGTLANPYLIEFLPDSGLIVDKDATFAIAPHYDPETNTEVPGEVYVIDKADWGKFVYSNHGDDYLVPVVYTPTRGANQRSYETMESPVIDINGKVEVNGVFATSEHGADIISSQGTGKITFRVDDAETGLMHYIQNNPEGERFEFMQTASAKLKNADGSYTETAAHTANERYAYIDGVWQKQDAYIAFYNVTLGDNINIGYLMYISPEIIDNAQNLRMVFTIGGETPHDVIVGIDDAMKIMYAGDSTMYYEFRCPVVAKEMNEIVSAKLIDDDKVYADNMAQSVCGYSEKLLESEGPDFTSEAKALVKAMLNYGAASQIYFNWDTEHPANSMLSDADKAVPECDFNEISPSGESVEGTLPDGVTYAGSTLMLESETAIRFFFKGDITGLTFKIDGEIVEPVEKRNLWCVQSYYLRAAHLGDAIDLEVSDGMNTWNISYTVWDYAKKVQNAGNNPELLNVMQAMYDYWLKAEAYIDTQLC